MESASERGGFKVRFSVETGTWWLGGVAGKRKEKEGAVDRSSSCQLCSEKESRNVAQHGNEDALTS